MPRTGHAAGPGFTLVEVLIVVVILGIIAAIVVPQFSVADDDAKEASLLATIRLLRKQISLYKAEHNGNGPHVGGGGMGVGPTDRLTQRTDIDGNISADGPYGPYLSAWPANPFSLNEAIGKTIAVGTDQRPPRNGVTGWYYNIDTCVISANSVTGGESSDPP